VGTVFVASGGAVSVSFAGAFTLVVAVVLLTSAARLVVVVS
jgi:hypothetical protein